jgi:3-methyladenine DNA glycosylase AlkD
MEYFQPLKESFEKRADPIIAAGAKAYMRNISEFYGLGSPLRRELLQEFIKNNGLPHTDQLETLVHFAWSQPQREWQYIAMEITERLARKRDGMILSLAGYMITHKSWWDTVDYISPNIAGAILKRNPGIIHPQIESWMQSENLWLQRSCLLFQLKYRNETDQALLFELCERLSGHKDFFIRKAIGWSLREYSKRNPQAVVQFVDSHPLSPLSYREAIKRINR